MMKKFKNNTLQDEGYRYYAFISYKRADEKWAKWLHKKLQSYHLPSRLCKKHKNLPPKLNPVFLDRKYLKPGYLEEELKQEAISSKYLIVVCSAHTAQAPKYIDNEIEYFLSGGHDASNIIPFIVGESERPEIECFPPALRKINEERTLLGVNVNEAGGRRSAFLKLVASMHQLDVTELENDENRRVKRNKTIAAIAAVCMLMGGIRAFDYFVPHTDYYNDYVTRYGVAEGVGKLKTNDIRSMSSHYTIVTHKDKVVELRRENSAGELVAGSNTLRSEQYSKAVYTYTDGGGLESITCYDSKNKVAYIKEYSENLKTVDLTSGGGGEYGRAYNISAQDTSEAENNDWFKVRSGITRWLIEYDENGFEKEIRYADVYNNAMAESNGSYGERYERDEKGRVVKLRYLDTTGDDATLTDKYTPGGTKRGVWGFKAEYNEKGNCTRVAYFGENDESVENEEGYAIRTIEYEGGNAVKVALYDKNNKPVMCKEGYSAIAYEYDEKGNAIKVSLYDTLGKATVGAGGLAMIEREFDKKGNITEERYYGAASEPVGTKEGYAKCRISYDDNNNPVQYEYYNLGGVLRKGAAIEKNTYDEAGYVVRMGYYDSDGKAVLGADGFAFLEVKRNKKGEVESVAYYDEEGYIKNNAEGYAIIRYEYDSHTGNVKKQSYFDAANKPVITDYGYASIEREYENGREIRTSYQGIFGEGIEVVGYARVDMSYTRKGLMKRAEYYLADGSRGTTDGYAAVEYKHDGRGNIKEWKYYDENDKPCTFNGYHRWVQEYDEKDNAVLCEAYDDNGEKVLCNYGYAAEKREYDQKNRVVKNSFYDTEGKLTVASSGYAVAEYGYDEAGNTIRYAYYGEDNKPLKGEGVYAVAEYEYDNNKNGTRQAYYGADGKLTVGPDGYAVCEKEYDHNGNATRYAYYDENNHLTEKAYGYAVNEVEYDKKGRIIRDAYYGEDSLPMIGPGGYAVVEAEYDSNENITREAYYGADNLLMKGPGGFAVAEVEYDARGNVLYQAYYGEDNSLVRGPDGYAVGKAEYDSEGNMLKKAYYDENSLPSNGPYGYATYEATYNENGKFTRQAYYNEEGNLTEGPYGYALYEAEYDEAGNTRSEAYYGKDNRPVTGPDGYASGEAEYDKKGERTRVVYYDENGSVLENRLCIVGQHVDAALGSSLEEFYVIISLGDWDYRDYTDTQKAVDAFGEEMNSVYGEHVGYEYLYYDKTAEKFIMRQDDFYAGNMGMRIMDMKISMEEYRLIMEGAEE